MDPFFAASLRMSRAGQIMISDFKRQLLRDRGAKSRFAHIFAHDECADGADVDDTELGQLFRD
jgi:hypothetical protein